MIERRELRKFGLLVGGITVAIGLWPLSRGGELRAWAVAIGSTLAVLGTATPVLLAWPYRAWMRIGALLGWFNTRVLLGLVFFVILTPIALLMRIMGRDPLDRAFKTGSPSYRIAKEPREADHFERMF